jgi:D-glycero-alpha-D-manno-heptose-7-phosphate kinase
LIITRTPFRVSFAGGGTDLREFYSLEPGAVVSTAIRKYMYITVNRSFDSTIRVSYSRTEIVSRVDDIMHPVVKAALKLVGIDGGIEIVSIADVPAGTGLGSSSSFTVGLLNALYAYTGRLKSAADLAREACRIEIDILGEPIGKQDQYAAAHGGLCHYQFNPDESVFVSPLIFNNGAKMRLETSLLLLYTGATRPAGSILAEQKANTRREDKLRNLKKMRDLAGEIRRCVLSGFSLEEFGGLLHQGWLYKKELAGGISNSTIDDLYQSALHAGALGGKLLGAGGGGFLLLVCPPEKRASIRQALGNPAELEFSFDPEGSKIIYVVDNFE